MSALAHIYLGGPKDPEDLVRKVMALRHALLSAIEDVSVTSPWTYHSYYPHFLDHEDFLRHQFSATDSEVEEFVRRREEGFLATSPRAFALA